MQILTKLCIVFLIKELLQLSLQLEVLTLTNNCLLDFKLLLLSLLCTMLFQFGFFGTSS